MKLEPPGVYEVTTKSSTYLIDTAALLAVRGPRAAAVGSGVGAPGATAPVHRPLFTDRAPVALTEVPEPVTGQRMRMRIQVAEEFIDHASRGEATYMLTTEVVAVRRVPPIPTAGVAP